jgi:hypothetical protein
MNSGGSVSMLTTITIATTTMSDVQCEETMKGSHQDHTDTVSHSNIIAEAVTKTKAEPSDGRLANGPIKLKEA